MKLWHAIACTLLFSLSIVLCGCGGMEQGESKSADVYARPPEPIVEDSSREIDRPSVIDRARQANEMEGPSDVPQVKNP